VGETLPSGTEVTQQETEAFETLGLNLGTQQIPTEGFEQPFFSMSEFSISVDPVEATVGEPVSVSGEALDEDGNNLGGSVDYTTELRDQDGAVVDAASGTTDATGYDATVTPPEAAEYTVQTANDAAGRQASVGFDTAIMPDNATKQGSEDFE